MSSATSCDRLDSRVVVSKVVRGLGTFSCPLQLHFFLDKAPGYTAGPVAHCVAMRFVCTGCDDRRRLTCEFDDERDKILVNRDVLARLKRQAQSNAAGGPRGPQRQPSHGTEGDSGDDALPVNRNAAASGQHKLRNGSQTQIQPTSIPVDAVKLGIDLAPEDEDGGNDSSVANEQPFVNSLMNVPQSYATDVAGKQFYLGTSSNWSFGRRVLAMAHERLFEGPLPREHLLFKGEVYDLEAAGSCDSIVGATSTVMPTEDFALFLINGVRFRCCKLFHLFDEQSFMSEFDKFHRGVRECSDKLDLWYVHYTLILAIGKALHGEYHKGPRPSGADFFEQSMRVVPHLALARAEPMESIEILCCAALYLQSVDRRQSAYSLIGQALRIALFEGLHTDANRHCSEKEKVRYQAIWWTVYTLDTHLSSILGVPQSLAAHDVSAKIPSSMASGQDLEALTMHVNLAKAASTILRTVYSSDGQTPGKFIDSIRHALRSLAIMNDSQITNSSLRLGDSPLHSLSRTSAYLQLFHRQCIILATRPLLFCLWQQRLASDKPIRISPAGGVRSLIRICVGAGRQMLQLLSALQSQSLLESFITFDLESTWSATVLMMVANAVDPSLLAGYSDSQQITYSVLDEMFSRGNLVAGLYRDDLNLLAQYLENLNSNATNRTTAAGSSEQGDHHRTFDFVTDSLSGEDLQLWDFDSALTGEQLIEVADSLNLDGLDWLTNGSLNFDMSATFM
ncbi:hypothetical protein Q7P37_008083 [Cladosporium fusiforme]